MISIRSIFMAFCMLVFLGTSFFGWAVLKMPDPDEIKTSTVITDSEGRVLRAFLTSDEAWRFPARLDNIDPTFIDSLLLVEDKRFWHHFGVDPLAVMRALGQLIINGSVVSGASTITMQLARLLDPRPRTLWAKLIESSRAIALEFQFDKQRILDLYLTLAPYGGNLEGVRAASLAYLGKEANHLTAAEIALLIAIPQAPERLRPDRNKKRSLRARNLILSRLSTYGTIDKGTYEVSRNSALPSTRASMPFSAPHLARRLGREGNGLTIRTTIDANLQRRVENSARRWVKLQARNVNLAIVVADMADGAVRAHVGSADFFGKGRAGQVDFTRAVRSPGSTLKPFIYAMAIEEGLLDPRSIVTDAPALVSSYTPENFGDTYTGEVTVAEALRQSLNQPVIQILEHFGPVRFLERMKRSGISPILPQSAERAGLAIGLGGVGLTLEDLVSVYTALGTGGQVRTLKFRVDGPTKNPQQLLAAGPAWEVRNILSGRTDHTRSIAWKTGTSYGYRDAWSIGMVDNYVIGVWVGRADGSSRPGYYGRNTAAPLMFDVINQLFDKRSLAELPPPQGWVPMRNRPLPLALQYFPARTNSIVPVQSHFKINVSSDGAILDLAGSNGVTLSVTGGRRPFFWMINRRPIPSLSHRRDLWWEPDGPGFATIVVLDANGKVVRTRVEVRGLIQGPCCRGTF